MPREQVGVQTMKLRRVSRRRALQVGLGAVGAGAVLGAFAGPARQTRSALRRATPAPAAPELTFPQVFKSAGGELAVNLTAVPAVVEMGAPRPVSTYTYNRTVPSATWELDPGDTLRVDLVNDLPPVTNPAMDITRPHQWTNTNLHTHGLHVSPSGNSDNIFLDIAPGERQEYEIVLPKDHPAGLFWYHPHRHGAVTQQVRAGMAGAIVVRGDLDEVEEVRAAKEQIMVLQAIEVGDDYQLLDPIPNPTTEQAFFPRTHILYTVNGVFNPKITMYPGEVQRWRLVNAAEGKFMSLQLTGHDLNVIAWDGLTLAEPEGVELVLLSSGNRVEILVKAGKPGKYDLVLTPGSSQKPNIPGMPAPREAAATPAAQATPMASMPGMATPQAAPSGLNVPGELAVRPIMTLEVTGSGPEMALPSSLPAWDPPALPIARKRDFAFTVEREPDNQFISFGIDGLPFDPARPPYQAKLNTAEEWTLTNDLDLKLADHAHVYHAHVDAFKITNINGRTLEKPLWRDTFVLTGKTGDSLTFEMAFTDFTGKFVEHCHVLSHEDLGMMSAIEVIE